MKLKAGIIGPKDYVELTLEIIDEYENLQPVPLIYKQLEEINEILEQKVHNVDFLIFTGPAHYRFIDQEKIVQPFYVLKLDGASLTKTLLDIAYNEQKPLERVSIDLLPERDVYETFYDLGIPSNDVYTHEFSNETEISDLINFHKNLYLEGKVNFCITCLRSVYEELQNNDIPTYRVTPTRSNIRETLSSAIQQQETIQFKQSQIAVIHVQVQGFGKKELGSVASYELHKLNLKIQSAVLNFTEAITGSFVTIGSGYYAVFSTRGSIQESDKSISSLLEELILLTDSPSHIGIGYGDTSLSAEEHARLALSHAQAYNSHCAFLVDHDGTIEGPLREEESIRFHYRTEDSEISKKLENSGITITTYNKILSVQKRIGNGTVTAQQIAEWLKMTTRNARRILNNLVEQGIAEMIGEEAPTTKGRPRKIYRIHDKI